MNNLFFVNNYTKRQFLICNCTLSSRSSNNRKTPQKETQVTLALYICPLMGIFILPYTPSRIFFFCEFHLEISFLEVEPEPSQPMGDGRNLIYNAAVDGPQKNCNCALLIVSMRNLGIKSVKSGKVSPKKLSKQRLEGEKKKLN